jgi:hypothetical protein
MKTSAAIAASSNKALQLITKSGASLSFGVN